MNKSLQISLVLRKKVALLMLLNFLFSTIYFALPQENCNGLCEISKIAHACETKQIEKNCCKMMGMLTDKNSSCDTEISDTSCDYEFSILNNSIFIIPETIDSKIELTTISILDFDIVGNSLNKFIHFKEVVPKISPPIYLSVSSFLI